jgi:hypothetical protein
MNLNSKTPWVELIAVILIFGLIFSPFIAAVLSLYNGNIFVGILLIFLQIFVLSFVSD